MGVRQTKKNRNSGVENKIVTLVHRELLQPQTSSADDIIFKHFLQNYGTNGKIFEEKLFISRL
jgi:hypothetical protein